MRVESPQVVAPVAGLVFLHGTPLWTSRLPGEWSLLAVVPEAAAQESPAVRITRIETPAITLPGGSRSSSSTGTALPGQA